MDCGGNVGGESPCLSIHSISSSIDGDFLQRQNVHISQTAHASEQTTKNVLQAARRQASWKGVLTTSAISAAIVVQINYATQAAIGQSAAGSR
jgi:hypothetical protein